MNFWKIPSPTKMAVYKSTIASLNLQSTKYCFEGNVHHQKAKCQGNHQQSQPKISNQRSFHPQTVSTP